MASHICVCVFTCAIWCLVLLSFNIIPIDCEWRVDRCGSKTNDQNDICSKEVGLYAQIMLTICDYPF